MATDVMESAEKDVAERDAEYVRYHFNVEQALTMMEAGIRDNDVLVVDRSVPARVGCIVVAVVNGELTVKTLGRTRSGQPLLVPANAG